MKKLRFTWPLYLAITFGAVAVVDLAFDVFGLGKATLGGIVFSSIFFIVIDLLTGDTPPGRRSEEEI